jgi:holo-[acyl-carrier protein] synthase
MRIIGIGTDLLKITRMQAVWQRHPERLITKLLSPIEQEILYRLPANKKVSFISKSFAAKEAVAKSLGQGLGGNLLLSELSIVRDQLGKPEVLLAGKSAKYVHSLGKITLYLSLSDEKEYVLAFAVAAGSLWQEEFSFCE